MRRSDPKHQELRIMPGKKTPREIEILLAALDDAYDKTGWHGPTLRGAVRRVNAREAVWRPDKGSHCIAEIVVHCAYWKYAGHRRLTGGKRGGFPIKGSNWFAVPDKLSDSKWKESLRLIDEMHARMRATIASLPANRLAVVPTGAKVTNLKMIYGLAAHDAYHAGQIRIIRGLFKQTSKSR